MLGCSACILAGCAGLPERPLVRAMDAQGAREAALAAHPDWQLQGRLAVHSTRQQGSGSVVWQQTRGSLRFEMHAPVSRRGWLLSAGPDGASLLGLDEGEVRGNSAESLLRSTFEWEVPIESLAFWVRGARAPGPAKVLLDADGLPKTIEQAGWTIEYREWKQAGGLSLPRKVFASQGANRVRLVVDTWSLEPRQ